MKRKGLSFKKMAKIGIILSGAASKGAYEYGFLKAIDHFFQKDEIKLIYSVLQKYSTPEDIEKMKKFSSYFQ